MWVDGPANNATVSGGITVAGWAVDLGHPSSVGVTAVHVWAFPTSGATPIFMGAATLGGTRRDVAAAFAANHLSSSGFHLSAAALPPGVHDIGVYAHSAITGTFNNSQVIRVTVTAPVSIPRMAVDLPVANQVVSQNFRVAGWALDLGASSGTGVDAVHIWAYPISGAPPRLVGVATIGRSRPDVAGAFGAARHGKRRLQSRRVRYAPTRRVQPGGVRAQRGNGHLQQLDARTLEGGLGLARGTSSPGPPYAVARGGPVPRSAPAGAPVARLASLASF